MWCFNMGRKNQEKPQERLREGKQRERDEEGEDGRIRRHEDEEKNNLREQEQKKFEKDDYRLDYLRTPACLL